MIETGKLLLSLTSPCNEWMFLNYIRSTCAVQGIESFPSPRLPELILHWAQLKFIPRHTIMRHNTTVRAILGGVRVWVFRVNEKYDPIGTRFATTEDVVPFANGKLPQLLAGASRGEI